MKKFTITLIALIFGFTSLMAQSPQTFKYQAVARDNLGKILVNQLVGLRISILKDSPLGATMYMETHTKGTNEFGIVTLNVGGGTAVTGNFNNINWSNGEYFIKTELDIAGTGTYIFIGSSQLLSVPFALHSEYATKAGKAMNDQDTSATNELQTIVKTGNTITLSQNGGSVIDSDNQTLTLTGNQLTISNGNTLVLSGAVDLDSDPTNEIQNLSIGHDTLHLSLANQIILPHDNLTLNYDTLKLSNSNQVVFPHDADRDSTNEIQQMQLSHNTLHLTKANTITIDADTTNEIQSLYLSSDTLYITKSNNIFLPYIPFQNQGIPVGFDTVCNLQNEGKLRYNFMAKKMQFCNGIDWLVLNYSLTDTLKVNTSFNHVTEIGLNNGVISINITGGLLPYSINWNNGSHSALLNNLSSGTYTVTVSDANLSTVVKSITIYEPLPISDIVGNFYNTVTIGSQVWMKENLKTTKYRNNISIPNVSNNSTWGSLATGARCYFNNDSINYVNIYGALYNWYAVNSSNGICPTGWHVPSDIEWTQLSDYLGGESIAGGKMKEAGIIHWSNPNIDADNSSGFTALPGGNRGTGGSFGFINSYGYWWTSTVYDTANAWQRILNAGGAAVSRVFNDEYHGLSLRCVKD